MADSTELTVNGGVIDGSTGQAARTHATSVPATANFAFTNAGANAKLRLAP